MGTLMKADIFFFVTTVCVVFFSIFLIILVAYLIKLVQACRRLVDLVTAGARELDEEARELLDRISGSFLFRIFFPERPKKRKGSSAKK